VRGASRRRILHLDLDPFFVAVERSLDPSLAGLPVVIGGDGGFGVVAAASAEARERGVRPGQSLSVARERCPEGVFRPGDLETYARVSEEVTALLLCRSRRVERPSADEAYVDLTPEGASAPAPVAAAESIKEEVQRRLGLDASLGLASTRLAARVASSWARPRGLLVVLPGYEASFLGRQRLTFLPDLPPHLETALTSAGFDSLGQIAEADLESLAAIVGPAAARLQQAVRGELEEPIPVAAPPSWIQEEARIRDRRTDRPGLEAIVDGLAERACRRLRPFGLRAELVSVEVRRGETAQRRSEAVRPGLGDEETARAVARALAEPLLEPAGPVRSIQLRLGRLAPPSRQPPLFPELRRASGDRLL
jgi:DNA polymerase IV